MTTSSTSSTTATAGVGGGAHSGGVPMTPILFILGSCISLQFGAALATQLFPAIGSWGTTALRLGLAAAVLIVIVRPKIHRFTRQQWLGVAAFGVAVGGMNGAFYASIDRIPLGTAVAIEFLGPLVLSALLSTRRTDLLWVLLALGGVSLFGFESLTGAASLDVLGVVFALVAAVFWALYVLASAHVGRIVPGQDGLAVAMLIGALAVLPLGAPGAIAGIAEPRLLLIALGTALLASVLPYTLELSALRRLPRHVFGIMLSLEPVVALFAGVLLLSQEITPLRVTAAVLVVVASAGVTLTARSRPAGEPQPIDEAPGWELPTPTHATLTGEMPILTEDDLREDGDASTR
ncbi:MULTISPECIES: EamA family transporter [Brachybacterium]|uniref:EamA family transporter n=1 Tax=Brachybacterium TaxID=43668 RepID=UPI0006B5C46A|nr:MULTISPECIES: EamA family transporter [Brachybacterium]GAP77235.1 putative integral membrane protein [Brachybacterium sp. SW0106-09]